MGVQQVVAENLFGEFWLCHDVGLRGWICNLSDPLQRLEVSLWQGDTLHAKIRANLFLDDLELTPGAWPNDSDFRVYGFEISGQMEILSKLELEISGRRYTLGSGETIRVVEPAMAAAITSRHSTVREKHLSTIPTNTGQDTADDFSFRGKIETCFVENGQLTLEGWVQNSNRAYDNVTYDLVAGDLVIKGLVARDLRNDLRRNGIGAGYHGLCVVCPVQDSAFGDRVELRDSESGRCIVAQQIEVRVQAEETVSSPGVDLLITPVKVKLERVYPGRVEGWARYAEHPETPVLLDLFLDGVYYATSDCGRFRPDVAKHFGDTHTYGFLFELPLNLDSDSAIRVSVRPRHGVLEGPVATMLLQVGPEAHLLPGLHKAAPRQSVARSVRRGGETAYIVLNLNTANLLQDLFESFERYNTSDPYEILIIDHGSTDNSAEICAAWAKKLNIRFIERGNNYSFSASNNFGAQETDAETLVFLNNDIVLTQNLSAPIQEALSDDDVGVVGIKLYDQKTQTSFQMPPVQHLGVLFSGDGRGDLIKPFEQRYSPQLEHVVDAAFDVPCVTGAVMACRRDEFLQLGGFDTGFFYGYEDVDLCLKYRLLANKDIVSLNSVNAFHIRGYSRSRADDSVNQRRRNNGNHLQGRFGALFRRAFARDMFGQPGYWTGKVPVIAFAVTEATMDTAAGDYFTALELAMDLQREMPCQIAFLDKGENWFDLRGVDVLITMRDDYDLRKIKNAAPHLITVGWARNWIDRWSERPWAQDYNLIWASSQTAADFLQQAMARPVEVVRIATNPDRFQQGQPDPELRSDYCFTGSFFGAPRDIIYNLDPAQLPYDFGLFGHNWDQVSHLAGFSRGPQPYTRMPDIYASTRIVIDDANTATKQWGSVNSRVYDAIAAGALVLTNGVSGAEEVFGGVMPVYQTGAELEALLRLYLEDEAARVAKVAELQSILRTGHEYKHRAQQIAGVLQVAPAQQLRFAIKIGAPRDSVQEEWGDYHFAVALRRALTRMGHSVRIDCIDRWEGDHCIGDDVVIVLRGLTEFKPRRDQITLMWNISHPDMVSVAEYNNYDHVFIASQKHVDKIAGDVDVSVSCLLQCTDPGVFDPEALKEGVSVDPDKLLFVGNSRNIFRQIVRDSVDQGLALDVYGSRWEQFIGPDILKASYLPNQDLAGYYAGARAVLNDHWDDMRDRGFISNRLFDAGAAGAYIITDEVEGMAEIFGDAISMVRTPEELAAAAALPETDPERVAQMRRKLRQIVLQGHSFDARAKTIMAVVGRRFDEIKDDLQAETELRVN